VGMFPDAAVLPESGTLREIADVHKVRVAEIEQDRIHLLANVDEKVAMAEAKIDEIRLSLAVAEADLAAAETHRAEVLAAYDAKLDARRAEAAEAQDACNQFRARVAAEGFEHLDLVGVNELLQLLGIYVADETLHEHKMNGETLSGITENEMLSDFGIKTLGERRKFALALRRLSRRGGFEDATALRWDTERVCAWLVEQGMPGLRESFRAQRIDGEVLLALERDDLKAIGITAMGDRAALMKSIEAAKKQHYAGQVVGEAEAAAADDGSAAGALSPVQQRLVLEQVLQENAALGVRISSMQEQQASAAAAAAAPPEHFLCPITQQVMEEPVMAADGFTYEREAIETWFRRRDTSPMTNQAIAPMLIPNNVMRSQIASWNE